MNTWTVVFIDGTELKGNFCDCFFQFSVEKTNGDTCTVNYSLKPVTYISRLDVLKKAFSSLHCNN